MALRTRTRSLLAAGTVLLGAVLAVGWWALPVPAGKRATPAIVLRRADGPLTLAAAGDSVIGHDLPDAGTDPGFDGVVKILRASTLAVTDLEQTLGGDDPGAPEPPQATRWARGTRRTATDLKRIGFTIVAQANDHTGDEGADGIVRTGQQLAEAGLAHAGAGIDLAAARRAVVVGAAPRRVALVAVSTSVLPEHRATATRGEIHGRAGVSTLKYSASIVADPATYLALTQVAAVSGQPATGEDLNLSGTTIKKGARTKVDFVADARDTGEILAEIARARANADIVVVSLHSHEPENRSDAPADFVRAFARQAVDAGASLVVGHGPRQLRGIEIYHGSAILYSLGSFSFDLDAIGRDSANVFDTAMNFYERAVSSRVEGTGLRLADYREPFWWQSVIATATFDAAVLKSVTLTPIALTGTAATSARGTPRLAATGEGDAILSRLADLSASFGTQIAVKDGVGIVAAAPLKDSDAAAR